MTQATQLKSYHDHAINRIELVQLNIQTQKNVECTIHHRGGLITVIEYTCNL